MKVYGIHVGRRLQQDIGRIKAIGVGGFATGEGRYLGGSRTRRPERELLISCRKARTVKYIESDKIQTENTRTCTSD